MAPNLPPFEDSGDLPPGVYHATVQEVAERFGAETRQRKLLHLRLERIYGLAVGTGNLRRFVVFGSYVTAKREPNDVDVFLIMEDEFDSAILTGEARILFDHGAAQAYFGASVFWVRRIGALGGEDEAVRHWQATRATGLRGIVE